MVTKKLLFLFSIFISIVGTKALAYDIAIENADGVIIKYNYINDGTELEVTEFNYKYKGPLVIPEEVTYMNITLKVTSIGQSAFDGCENLTSVTIPNGVTSIGWYAFNLCRSLTSITIPKGVTSIGKYAFDYCQSLTSIIIPNSVTNIGIGVFEGCSGLTSISVESGNTEYDSRNNCNGIIESKTNTLIAGCQNTTIPNSVTSIGYYAFSGCTGLTAITIPNSVTYIGDYAFKGCGGLIYLKVEEGNLKYDSRNDCNAIIETSSNSLIVGSNNTIIPNSVTSIGSYAFYNCSGLTSISIPNSVTSIVSYTFSGCSSLTSITIPESITFFDNDAFVGTAWYNNQPDGLVYAGKYVYKYKGEMPAGTNITIKSGTLGIANDAFQGCSGLASIIIPNSVTFIGRNAFRGCITLSTVTIPNSVSDIGWWVFDDTAWYKNQPDGLVYAGMVAYKYKGEMPTNTNLIFKNGTLGLAANAIRDCSGLTSITIPSSVISIGSMALSGCSGLLSIEVENGNTKYDSRNNCNAIIEKSSNTLIAGCKKSTIPNNVTSIGVSAFYGCKGLTSVTIPNSVTSIGISAFSGCSGLTSVTIPNSVMSIGSSAFSGCSSLTTIMSEINIPFLIDNGAFSYDNYTVAELIVPYGTKAAYQATKGWNLFTMITEAADKDGALFTIDGITYEGTKSAKNVEVKSVDKNKTSIEIPAVVSSDGTNYTVTGVTDNVFDGCNMAALVWNLESALSNNAFSNASIGSNFLLYVRSSSYAPSSVKNVVVNGMASSIQLSDDGGQFYCPQAFKANSISYTHNYSMETGGNGKGWETIALPFDVQRIVHSTRGEIVPFAGYSSGSNQKPFWLASLSASGFKRASSIQAYEPYIIAMPNNNKYKNDYNLAGDVTFSADNVQVAKTPSFSGLFLPAFDKVPQSSTVYALNVTNRNVKYSGSYEPGSRFISALRDVSPFEAYMTSSSSSRGVIGISFEDGTTDMEDIMLSAGEDLEVTIYTLSGQQVAHTTQRDFDQVWSGFSKGVYIVNGKKRIK